MDFFLRWKRAGAAELRPIDSVDFRKGVRRKKKNGEEKKRSQRKRKRENRKEKRGGTEEKRYEDFILVTRGDIFNSSNADCGLNPWWALFHIRALELLDPMRDSHTIILDAKPLFHVSLIRSSPAFLLLSLCLPFFPVIWHLQRIGFELRSSRPSFLDFFHDPLSSIRLEECSLSSRTRTSRSNLGPSILPRFLAGNRAEN